MKNELIKSIGSLASKGKFTVVKYSPQILLAAGTTAVVAGTVMACKSTVKAQDIIDKHKNKVEQLEENKKIIEESGNEEMIAEYPIEAYRAEKTKLYLDYGVKMVKNYAPAILLVGGGIGCFIWGHKILSKRNVALVAAYKAIDESYKTYRKRVVDEYGPEKDVELLTGAKILEESKKIKIEGGEVVKTKTLDTGADLVHGVNSVWFDESSTEFKNHHESNLFFLRSSQKYANDLLQSRGYLFLNEVYKMLGLPETSAGQLVGWVYDENDPLKDNYVMFGVFDYEGSEYVGTGWCTDPETGVKTVLLDFNTDGYIADQAFRK